MTWYDWIAPLVTTAIVGAYLALHLAHLFRGEDK